MFKKKITELVEEKWRTVHDFDEEGNRIREQVPYEAIREVRTIKSWPRFGHLVVDIIIFNIIAALLYIGLVILFYFTTQSEETVTIANSVFFIGENLSWLFTFPIYCVFWEAILQRTPGKFLTKSLVIDEYGDKPDFGTILLRSVIRIIPFEAFSCLDEYSHGWHDKWSKTWVVKEEELAEIKRLQDEQQDPELRY